MSIPLYTSFVESIDTTAVMDRVRAAFERSELSLEELGARMGIESKTARQSAWQFLNRTADPRLSMLIRFATAVGITVDGLLVEPEQATKPKKPKK